MKLFKQLSLLLCILMMPVLAVAGETAVAEEAAAPKIFTADFEYVQASLEKVAPAESVLATAAAVEGSGETRGWFIGFSPVTSHVDHSSLPWWVVLSLVALVLAPIEERITRSIRRIVVAIQN